jgi:outer membrane lipoprotein carrier protein
MKRLLFRPFTAAVLAFSVFPAGLRAAASPDELLSRIEKAEDSVQTLTFSFTQKTRIKVTEEDQVIDGKAYFRRPDRFRVEHLSPRPMTAVSDGKTIWVHNPARNQVITDQWENWAASSGFPRGLMPFQEKTQNLRLKYNITREGEDQLVFVPKEPGAWPYVVRVWVDPKGFPRRTELESDSLKTSTEVRNLEANPALPDSLFIFKTPRGADVISPQRPKERFNDGRDLDVH